MWEFLFLIYILNTIRFTPPPYILKLLVQITLKARSEEMLGGEGWEVEERTPKDNLIIMPKSPNYDSH